MSTALLPLIAHQQRGGKEVIEEVRTQTADYDVSVNWGTGFEAYFSLANQADHGIKSIRIRRGRDDLLSSMPASTATIVLHDPDGLYNPLNQSSPLYGALLPMKPVQVTADNGAPFGYIFGGFIRSIEHNPHPLAQETTIECVDGMVVLEQAKPIINYGSTPPSTVGELIDDVVGFAEGPSPPSGLDPPAFGNGSTAIVPDSFTDGSKTALQVIEELLAIDRGVFYTRRDGSYVYEPPDARTDRESVATITDTALSLRPGVDLDRIGNRCRVTRTGGIQQSADDTASQDLYGIRDIGDIESPYLADDAAALALAEYLVEQMSSPRSPMFGLELINRDAETLTQIIERDLQDRITLVDNHGNSSGDYHIEGIEHEITDGGKIHRCRWILSARGDGDATGHVGVIGGVAHDPPVHYVEAGQTGPQNPPPGAVAYVEASAGGPVWQFRWNGSAWMFVGGPPLYAENTDDGTTTSSSFGDLTGSTAGPSVTLPFSGDYDVTIGCRPQQSNVDFAIMSYTVGVTAASINDAITVSYNSPNERQHVVRMRRKTGLTAGSTLTCKYAVGAGGTATFDFRWISVTPVKVTAL